MTRIIKCSECGGSGLRSCNGREFECFDCSGEGQWEAEDASTLLSKLGAEADDGLTETLSDPLPNEWGEAA